MILSTNLLALINALILFMFCNLLSQDLLKWQASLQELQQIIILFNYIKQDKTYSATYFVKDNVLYRSDPKKNFGHQKVLTQINKFEYNLISDHLFVVILTTINNKTIYRYYSYDNNSIFNE